MRRSGGVRAVERVKEARAPRLPLRGGARPRSSCCCAAGGREYGPSSGCRASASSPKRAEGGVADARRRSRSKSTASATAATPEGNSPGQRARPRPAGRSSPPRPAARRDRADQLQGPDPGRDARHRRRHPRPARVLRRRAGLGDGRRLGEHHREASWEALVDSLEYAFQPRGGPAGRWGCAAHGRVPETEPIHSRRARGRPARGGAGARGAALRAALRWGRWGERFESGFAGWLGVEDAVTVSSGTTAPCTSGCGRSAGAPATRS